MGLRSILPHLSAKFYPHEVLNSMRIEATDSSCYLYRTPAANGDLTRWTCSAWVKLMGSPDDYCTILSCNYSASDTGYGTIGLSSANSGWAYKLTVDGYYTNFRIPAAVYRDPSGWFHIHVVWDTAQATEADRIRVYVNGVRVTTWTSYYTPAQHSQSGINRNAQHRIGSLASGSSIRTRGYITDMHFMDGLAVEPSEVGSFKQGVWVPKAYSGSYGTNGFYLKFLNSGALGTDSSGNGNTFTATDGPVQTADTPTNNHCIMSGIHPGGTVTHGGLRVATSGVNRSNVGTFFVDITDPKGWAWKYTFVQAQGKHCGIVRSDQNPHLNPSSQPCHMVSLSSGELYYNGQYLGTPGTYDNAGDVLEFFIRSGGFYARKNGAWLNSGHPLVSGLTGMWAPFINTPNGNTTIVDWDFGQLGYVPPGDYKTLCAANLTDETILTSGQFTGNASTDGPVVFTNGPLDTLTINGNAVTWGTHAIKLANGFKVITSSTGYNTSGTNNWTATASQKPFKYANAQPN